MPRQYGRRCSDFCRGALYAALFGLDFVFGIDLRVFGVSDRQLSSAPFARYSQAAHPPPDARAAASDWLSGDVRARRPSS